MLWREIMDLLGYALKTDNHKRLPFLLKEMYWSFTFTCESVFIPRQRLTIY